MNRIEQLKNEIEASIKNYDAPEVFMKTAITCLRNSLSGEQKAIADYVQFAEDVKMWFPSISELFKSIADEEKVHVGELTAMLNRLENNNEFNSQGADEVKAVEDETINAITLDRIETFLSELANENFENKSDYYKAVIKKLL